MMKSDIIADRSISYLKNSKSLWTEYITHTIHDLTESTLIYHENNQKKSDYLGVNCYLKPLLAVTIGN